MDPWVLVKVPVQPIEYSPLLKGKRLFFGPPAGTGEGGPVAGQ